MLKCFRQKRMKDIDDEEERPVQSILLPSQTQPRLLPPIISFPNIICKVRFITIPTLTAVNFLFLPMEGNFESINFQNVQTSVVQTNVY